MKSRWTLLDSMDIEDMTDCPYGKSITVSALLSMKYHDMEKVGKTVRIFRWDPDRVYLRTEENPEPDDCADYCIRTWDFIPFDNGSCDVPYTIFKMVRDPDGTEHGEPVGEGTFNISKPEEK